MVWERLVTVMAVAGHVWTGAGPADPAGRFVRGDGFALSIAEALDSVRRANAGDPAESPLLLIAPPVSSQRQDSLT